MDGMPIYASAGQHGTSTYSNTVPVTTWIHEEITPMILSAISKWIILSLTLDILDCFDDTQIYI